MKFALAINGTRGDVEPCAAIGVELQRRRHEVRIGVPPNMIGFVESAGLTAVTYGPNSEEMIRDDVDRMGKFWKIQDSIKVLTASVGYVGQLWADMGASLKSLADGTDLLLTSVLSQGLAANVAEYYGIPMAVLHYFPARVNGQLVPRVPSPVIRSGLSAAWLLHWGVTKIPEDAQRRELGLPKTRKTSTKRIMERGSLDIQAYDELCFPGLAAEWAHWGRQRPFVGALTMEVPAQADDEVASWIAAGTPPIYFGFGSMPVQSPTAMVAMISAACARLGERALICAGANDFSGMSISDHVKIVPGVNHGAIFPACRAVVHHGGAGTTAAGMRAGVPTLILWIWIEQPIWAAQIKRLKIGSARRFSATSEESLVADLRSILTPQCTARAREIAERMTKPSESAAAAADALEDIASRKLSFARHRD